MVVPPSDAETQADAGRQMREFTLEVLKLFLFGGRLG
jgi:hypothetical protein